MPVEVTVTDLVTAVPTATLPNASEVLLRLRTGVAAFSWIAKLFEVESALAASVADCEVVTDATFAVNEMADEPAATVTLAGTDIAVLLLVTVTFVPADEAAELNETVHVVVPAPEKELVPHDKALTEGASAEAELPFKLIEVVLEVVPWVAVSVTVREDETAATVAVKPTLDVPDGIETEVGTDTALLVLAKSTARPPDGAGALNCTVHRSVPAPIIDGFEQLSPVSAAGAADPLPCSLTVPATLSEVPVLAAILSCAVESVVDPGS